DKRFILVSILSLALAIGLVNGTLMYLDSTVVGYFDDQLSLVDIDLAFEYDPLKSQEGTLSLSELDAHIREFYPEVSDTAETELLHIEKINNQSSMITQEKWHLCGSSDNIFDLFPREFNVTAGNLSLTTHGAAMEDNLATSLSLSIGDPFNVSFSITDTSGGTQNVTWYTLNYTLKSTFSIETSMEDIWFWNYNIRIITDLNELQTDLNQYPLEDVEIGDGGYIGQIFVRMNRQAVNPLSVYALISQIQTSTILTNQEYLNDVLNVYSTISWSIELFLDWSITLRVIFMAMGLPIIICGWLVAKHVVDIKTSKRSYEIGIMKSRGATSTQIKSTLRIEAFISGILGGLIALPLGWLVAWLISKVESFLVFNVTIIPKYPLGLPLWVVILSIGLTTALHYISYLTSSGVVNQDVVEATTKVFKEVKAGRPLIPLGFLLIFTVPTL
ncbi:MAG: ABC transporter permease, partial [Candidatus Hodarchaeales archaeon]